MSDLIERVEAACRFPANTCGASRHAAQIGVALVRDEPYPMLDEDPAYCGESILSVVASLWESRTEIERLTAERDEHARWRQKLADDLHDRETQIIELRQQLAEAEQDARRYRWLRNEANTARKCDPMVCIYPLDEQDLIDGDRLDVAIDAAMDLTRPAEES